MTKERIKEALQSKDYVMEHIYIGLQRSSEEEIEKRQSEFEGIEEYLYVRICEDGNSFYTAKMTKGLLRLVGIDLELAWDKALYNTEEDTVIESMESVLGALIGIETDSCDMLDTNMYVVSNKSRIKGASGILNKKDLRRLADERGIDSFVMLPSSVHETILVPACEDMDMELFNTMVRQVNEAEVAPNERLADRAYIIDVRLELKCVV